MTTLIRRWAVTKGYDKGAKVEQWLDSKNETSYTGRTRTGSAYNISSEAEAKKIVENFRMELVMGE